MIALDYTCVCLVGVDICLKQTSKQVRAATEYEYISWNTQLMVNRCECKYRFDFHGFYVI